MSYIETLKTEPNKAWETKRFYGLNRSENTKPGEFSAMHNMSSAKHPYISPSEPMEKSEVYNRIITTVAGADTVSYASSIRAAISPAERHTPEGFTGVMGTDFYYNGRKKPLKTGAVYKTDGSFDYGMEIAADGKIQLLRSNRIIIIHGYGCNNRNPYTYYYDTDSCGTVNDMVKSFEYTNPITEYKLSYLADGTGEIEYTYATNYSFNGGYWDFKAGDAVFIDGLMTYTDSRWDTVASNIPTSAICTGITESYEGYSSSEYKWKIVAKFRFTNIDGNSPFSSSGSKIVKHVYRKIPYMTHLCLHKGRLWGANPNGEYIYGSALGDIFNFNTFEGLSGDSIFLESSSGEGYLGVISSTDTIAAFKKNQLEIIYGELPEEFAVGRVYNDCGCADIDSCTVLDGVIYFLSEKGFCVWKGSRPVLISKNLDKKYSSAFGYNDGFKYYASAFDGTGYENLVFDPEYGLWHIEGNTKLSSYFKRDTKKYICSDGEIYELESKGQIEWSAESIKHFYGDYELNRVNELWVFARLDKESELEVHISSDDEEWIPCEEIKAEKSQKYRVYRIPVRINEGFYYRYKLSGKGGCVIYGVRAILDKGGRIYNNKRGD